MLDEVRLKALFVAGAGGDAGAYERFLHMAAGVLRAYYRRRMTTMPDEVEDLVQDALLAVHLQRHTYDTNQALGPWLYALARYKFIDLLRRRSRTDLLNDPLDEESDQFGTSDQEAGLAKRDLGRLLDTLPERQRLPIQHVKLEGLSVAEAAAATGMSESAVKVGIHRGLKALAARIRSPS
jgi:RNA polymerase sigma-70 factor (ECF subfamily)